MSEDDAGWTGIPLLTREVGPNRTGAKGSATTYRIVA
jgi:hypothetical protein